LGCAPEAAADLPEVAADRVQLQQVLMNLMLNGIEAMKDTGGILTPKSQSEIGHVLISFSDTGVGLPTDKADRIFDAFFTTKPQGSGRQRYGRHSIIESHGGYFWATPKPGPGASFHLSLPNASEQRKRPRRKLIPERELVDALLITTSHAKFSKGSEK
jgi:signal transduction histidine kinase